MFLRVGRMFSHKIRIPFNLKRFWFFCFHLFSVCCRLIRCVTKSIIFVDFDLCSRMSVWLETTFIFITNRSYVKSFTSTFIFNEENAYPNKEHWCWQRNRVGASACARARNVGENLAQTNQPESDRLQTFVCLCEKSNRPLSLIFVPKNTQTTISNCSNSKYTMSIMCACISIGCRPVFGSFMAIANTRMFSIQKVLIFLLTTHTWFGDNNATSFYWANIILMWHIWTNSHIIDALMSWAELNSTSTFSCHSSYLFFLSFFLSLPITFRRWNICRLKMIKACEYATPEICHVIIIFHIFFFFIWLL